MTRWAAMGVMIVLPAVGAVGAGCAPPLAEVLHAQAAPHVYHRPAPEVAAEVRALLAERGFTLTAASDDVWIRTQWKWILDDEEFATFRERYVILVKRLTAHHCRVEMVRFTLSTAGMEEYHPLSMSSPTGQHKQGTTSYGKGRLPLASGPRTVARDMALEWDLLQRLDPEKAHRLEASLHRK